MQISWRSPNSLELCKISVHNTADDRKESIYDRGTDSDTKNVKNNSLFDNLKAQLKDYVYETTK